MVTVTFVLVAELRCVGGVVGERDAPRLILAIGAIADPVAHALHVHTHLRIRANILPRAAPFWGGGGSKLIFNL